MTNANLEILQEYDADKLNNFELFADKLGLWATQYIPEISLTVAKYADELFDVPAVRILLDKWHISYKMNRKYQLDMFNDIANGNGQDVEPKDFENLYKTEQNAYNTALYALIIG